MATFDTRIQLKYDTLANWNDSTFNLMVGEVAIAELPAGTSGAGLTPPGIGIKVGDGHHKFSELEWIKAIAGDVYEWAKAAVKPAYTASEISTSISGKNVENRLATLESSLDSSSVYRIEAGTGDNLYKWFLQKKAANADDSAYQTISTIDLSTVLAGKQDVLEFETAYDASTNKVATMADVGAAVADLDASDTAVAGQLVSAVSETDGVITVSRRALIADDIPNLDASKITSGTLSVERGGTGKATFASGEVLVGNGTGAVNTVAVDTEVTANSNNLVTSGAVQEAIETATAGLSGAMHYKGVVAAIPPASGTYESGDVVLLESTSQEYIFDGTDWKLFGDEGSYALKTITVTGSDGLAGGGTLTENRTLTHAVPTGAGTSNDVTATANTFVNSVSFDKFGHVVGVGTAAETTYTIAEGDANGQIKVTPSSGSAYNVDIHGLGSAAYAEVAAAIDKTTNVNKLATAGQVADAVANAVDGLDGSATATAEANNRISVLTSVTQTDGAIAKGSEALLAAVAKTGNVDDLLQTANTYIIFNCGSASTVI